MNAGARGVVVRTSGEIVVAALPGARVGEGVTIECRGARGRRVTGIVAAVDRALASIAAFEATHGIAAGDRIRLDPQALECVLGYGLLGRAIDARGRPLDGAGPVRGSRARVELVAPPPGARAPVDRPLWTGVPAIDGPLAFGRGARVGLFGAPGCGKSTLLEAVCGGTAADAVVLALVGERGREAQAWFARREARTTIVCATSDRSAAERVRAAHVAMAQACALRERGLHVLLIVDSLARLCSAERERRASLGEPAGRGGYPAAVWAELARFLECAGATARGSVTLVATVLSDGGDEREPLSDNARSLLDGHVVLSSALARAGRFPAVDVLASASRTLHDVATPAHRDAARAVRAALARLAETVEQRALGLLAPGDERLEAALDAEEAIERYLRRTNVAPARALAELRELANRVERVKHC